MLSLSRFFMLMIIHQQIPPFLLLHAQAHPALESHLPFKLIMHWKILSLDTLPYRSYYLSSRIRQEVLHDEIYLDRCCIDLGFGKYASGIRTGGKRHSHWNSNGFFRSHCAQRHCHRH